MNVHWSLSLLDGKFHEGRSRMHLNTELLTHVCTCMYSMGLTL